jgi:hypothetical protein
VPGKLRQVRAIGIASVHWGNPLAAVVEIKSVHAVDTDEKDVFDLGIMGFGLGCGGAQ